MVTRVFEITDLESYPHWCREDNGRAAPMRELELKDVTEDPIVDEVMCVVYGFDAIKNYKVGEYVLATLEIFVGLDEDERRTQEIRVRGISKINIPQNS